MPGPIRASFILLEVTVTLHTVNFHGIFTANWEDMSDKLFQRLLYLKSVKPFPKTVGVYINFDGDDEGADKISEVFGWVYEKLILKRRVI